MGDTQQTAPPAIHAVREAVALTSLCDRLDHLNAVTAPQACADAMDEARLALLSLASGHARLTEERDEADRRAGAAERQHEGGLDTRLKAERWKRERKAERGYHDNVSFDRVWADTCALADRALAAEAEIATLKAAAARDAEVIARMREALKPFAEADAMDPPESWRLNDWLPAVTGARAARAILTSPENADV